MGIAPSEIGMMSCGMAVTVVAEKRSLIYEQFKIEEERVRRLCFYGSSWLDHKGKTSSDLYPMPWEVKNRKEKVAKDVAELTIQDFQERITQAGGAKGASDERGFDKLFGR